MRRLPIVDEHDWVEGRGSFRRPPVIVPDEEEWVVAKEWVLASSVWRNRARMLQCLMPFTLTIDLGTWRTVVTVQRHIRGYLGRQRARRIRAMRTALHRWVADVQRVHASTRLRLQMLRDYYAVVIQRHFREFLSRWTRPCVADLLRRIWSLERRVQDLSDDETCRVAPPKKRRKKYRPLSL